MLTIVKKKINLTLGDSSITALYPGPQTLVENFIPGTFFSKEAEKSNKALILFL